MINCDRCNQIIYNSSALCYLQLQYVQTFHNIKHLNKKPHWSERSTVWTLKLELSSTLKHTIQKWVSSRYSVTRSHETFRNGTVTHKTHTFTNPKSWVSCFGPRLPKYATMSSLNTFSAENATMTMRCLDVWLVFFFFFMHNVQNLATVILDYLFSLWVPF